MLWLAVHLPLLSLEACCATLPAARAQSSIEPAARAQPTTDSAARAQPTTDSAARAQPVALLADHRITHADAAAQERGVRPGMKRATALALAPDLLLAEADPARDGAALLAVAHAALAFTPAVALHDESTVVLEVQASLRLFGGLKALQARLGEALAVLNPPTGHHVQIAAAPTPLGAALLARWWPDLRPDLRSDSRANAQSERPGMDRVLGPHATQKAALARLLDAAPLWLLGPGRTHWAALQGMGLATLGELRALPRAGLARRFGEALLDELDRAYGHAPDPRPWLTLPERYEARLELQHRADNADQVLHAAAVLLARLVAWAQGRHGRIAAFTLAMKHEPHRHDAAPPLTELRVELAEPALDPAHLQLLLRERLAQVTLAAPTLELRLRCRHLVAAPAPNGELFPTRQSEALGLARLLERLGARLGDERVLCLLPVADHRPERATRSVPALSQLAALTRPASAGAAAAPDPFERELPLHRPVWLLSEPLPLAERGALPVFEGQPLQLVSGPERIEAGWWDGGTIARDYFIALAPDGALLWVWRSRLPPAPGEPPWRLQGRFG